MKKVISLILVVVLLFSFTACGSTSKDRLAEIKKKGYIEFTTEPYWAPNEFIDPTKTGDEQYVGSDIEIAKYIADKIGVDLKIIPLEFTALLTSITEGKYDMAISAIAWSFDREDAMNLSDGYDFGDDGYGFLVRKGDEGKYTSIDSLKDAVVITQSASIQEGIYKNYCNNAKELKLVGSMTDAYLAVSEGKADVCITDLNSGALYAEANEGITTCDFKFEVDKKMNSTVVALPKEGTDELMKIVNQCIAELTEQGKIAEWTEYYKDYARELGIE